MINHDLSNINIAVNLFKITNTIDCYYLNDICINFLQQAGGGGAPAAGVEIPSGAFVAKITNDAREDEMEENMEQVSSMVGNLRNMANNMGGELENQNAQLDGINMKAGSDIKRVKMANDKAAALLK